MLTTCINTGKLDVPVSCNALSVCVAELVSVIDALATMFVVGVVVFWQFVVQAGRGRLVECRDPHWRHANPCVRGRRGWKAAGLAVSMPIGGRSGRRSRRSRS